MGEIIVVCGALVFKDNEFVLVKEAQQHVYGKWNYPAGHLELGEDILTGAIREVKEETNLDIKLERLIGVYEHNRNGNNIIKFIFKASVISGILEYQKDELLDAKWFSFEEFSKLKDNEIRTLDIRKTVSDCKNGKSIALETINVDFIKNPTR